MNKTVIRFLKDLEYLWFSVFFVGAIVSVAYQVFGEGQSFNSVAPSLWQYIKNLYIPVALIILIFCTLFLIIIPLQLYFYYYIWIKGIYSSLKGWSMSSNPNIKARFAYWLLCIFFKNDRFHTLILKSFPEELSNKSNEYTSIIQTMSFRKNRPVFIRREHLMEKSFWPNWAFAEVVLFNKITLNHYKAGNEIKFCLKVDLRDQSHGIYGGGGKKFMRDIFMNEGFKSRCIKKSKEIMDFLESKTSIGTVITIEASETPFRWASGGMLLIAKWKDRYWYVLFFRDIEPVGWNIANGASETKEEYKNLYSLIYREFSEEIVLLSREPNSDDRLPIKQKIFQIPHLPPLPMEISHKIMNKEFIKKHRKLREEHDNLIIEFEDGPEIKPIQTPFEVQVTYHDINLRDTISSSVKDVIFNMNPSEFGIEVLLVSHFEMNEEDYLLDGEIWEVGPALVRQPMMLLSCDYVQKILDETGSIGSFSEKSPHLGCKYLDKIPIGEYKIFGKDIDFRQRRLKLLEKDSKTKELPEAERSKAWLDKYEELFRMTRESNCDITKDKLQPLTMLCPVTWKTMELICHYNLLDLKPK